MPATSLYGILCDLNRESTSIYYQGATLMLSASSSAICAPRCPRGRVVLMYGRGDSLLHLRPAFHRWNLLDHELVGYFIQKSSTNTPALFLLLIPAGSLRRRWALLREIPGRLPRKLASALSSATRIYVGRRRGGWNRVGGFYSDRFGEDNLTYQLSATAKRRWKWSASAVSS